MREKNPKDKTKRFKTKSLEERVEGEYFYARDEHNRLRVYLKYDNQAMTIRDFLVYLGFRRRTAPVSNAQQILSRSKNFKKSLKTILGWLKKEKDDLQKKGERRPSEIQQMMRRQFFHAAKKFFDKFNSNSMGEFRYLNDIEAVSQMLLHRATTQIRLGQSQVNNSYLITELLDKRVIREEDVSARVNCQLREAVIARLDQLDRKMATSKVLKGERLFEEVALKSVPGKEICLSFPGFEEDYIYINGKRYVRDVNGDQLKGEGSTR